MDMEEVKDFAVADGWSVLHPYVCSSTCLGPHDLNPAAEHLLLACGIGRNSCFSFCTYRSAYAGVATFCREQTAQPLAAEEGMTGTLPLQNSHASGAHQQRIHFSPFDTFWERCAVFPSVRRVIASQDSRGRGIVLSGTAILA